MAKRWRVAIKEDDRLGTLACAMEALRVTHKFHPDITFALRSGTPNKGSLRNVGWLVAFEDFQPDEADITLELTSDPEIAKKTFALHEYTEQMSDFLGMELIPCLQSPFLGTKVKESKQRRGKILVIDGTKVSGTLLVDSFWVKLVDILKDDGFRIINIGDRSIAAAENIPEEELVDKILTLRDAPFLLTESTNALVPWALGIKHKVQLIPLSADGPARYRVAGCDHYLNAVSPALLTTLVKYYVEGERGGVDE